MARRSAESTEFEAVRTLVLCVATPDIPHPEYYKAELKNLLETAGMEVHFWHDTKLRAPDKSYFLTKGKLEEVTELAEKHEIEHIVVSHLLSPLQERNLENMTGCKVSGRAEVILEIFQQSAHSAEGKIQVEMAILEHMKTRLAGRGKDLAQQEGFVGSRGPGETDKELLKRYYVEKLRQAKKKLDSVHAVRETQRKQRLASPHLRVSLVGYTNAGKSSILNRVTKSDILAEDKLFATLDTTTRELFVGQTERGKPMLVLLSDTVGFISNLPHQLIEAFRSTLDELRYAHLLLHVVDVSNPAWLDHIRVVKKTLKELSVKAPVLYIFNKVDQLDTEQQKIITEQFDEESPYIFTHTCDKEGINNLRELLEKRGVSHYKRVLKEQAQK